MVDITKEINDVRFERLYGDPEACEQFRTLEKIPNINEASRALLDARISTTCTQAPDTSGDYNKSITNIGAYQNIDLDTYGQFVGQYQAFMHRGDPLSLKNILLLARYFNISLDLSLHEMLKIIHRLA